MSQITKIIDLAKKSIPAFLESWSHPISKEGKFEVFIFGACIGGNNLKSNINWNGNNESYMSIVPGGSLNTSGGGSYMGSNGYYWINDYVGGNGGYSMRFNNDEINLNSHPYYTFLSVRCVKD